MPLRRNMRAFPRILRVWGAALGVFWWTWIQQNNPRNKNNGLEFITLKSPQSDLTTVYCSHHNTFSFALLFCVLSWLSWIVTFPQVRIAHGNPVGLDSTPHRAPNSTISRCSHFQHDVTVWQDGSLLQSEPPMRCLRVLIVDTGCQGANWISQEIVDSLRAQTEAISNPQVHVDFGGNEILATRQARISFKRASGGRRTFTETFYVLPTKDHPFELILGDEACVKLGILSPSVLGLVEKKQREDDKKKQEKRNEQYREDKNKQKREKDEKKKQKETHGEACEMKQLAASKMK